MDIITKLESNRSGCHSREAGIQSFYCWIPAFAGMTAEGAECLRLKNMLENITPLILTWNEEVNLPRTLARLGWAKRIVVVDSFSTDRTMEILRKDARVQIFQRQFDNHTDQWNYGLRMVDSEWVLTLDADYVLTDALVSEIQNLIPQKNGYFIPFKYCINGKPLSRTILPPRLALFRRANGKYVQDGHTQLLDFTGEAGALSELICHDDRKPFSRWLAAQKKYAKLEARKLLITSFSELNAQDKLRKMIFFAPGIVFLYCFFCRGLILDGRSGFVYSGQRFLAEFLLSLKLIEKIFNLKGGE